MHITLLDASTIRLRFPFNLADKDFVKVSLDGEYDGETKTWLVSLHHLRRILDRWPRAEFEDQQGTVAARLAMWRRWVRAFNNCGVWFGYDTDGCTVIPTGEGVSPLFVEYVRERSQILEQFLADQRLPSRWPMAPAPVVESSHGDALIWRGIENAKRNEERQEEMVKQIKVKRYQGQAKQGEMEFRR